MTKKENRFVVMHKEGSELKNSGVCQILADKETGVHYLVWSSGYAGGITPLLDSSGNVVIKKGNGGLLSGL